METIACFYSFNCCQFLLGEVDEQGNLLLSGGGVYRKITLFECAENLDNMSEFYKPIWINTHEPLKRALRRSPSGEVDCNEEDQELQDLLLSLQHEKKIKILNPDLEAIKSELPLALRILVKALMRPLSAGGFVLGTSSIFIQLGDSESWKQEYRFF